MTKKHEFYSSFKGNNYYISKNLTVVFTCTICYFFLIRFKDPKTNTKRYSIIRFNLMKYYYN